ncbi:alpha/beta hydrolase [Actinospica durhamensis]|uniref:Alpha/beta hydrolase n=1 Tax=Actinospica durhamensis TaxID=1508375 RepID=A0A941ISI6_9ACTN|nr:alpha/beta hydrolase [Actinospica durhamensis]MBR7838544.1 alpha/beta hydrolase [Actinospica durhamensis]
MLEDYATGSVPSADGTGIGFRYRGEGPAVVLLHGSMESGLNHIALADALAGAFTVYLPDRRGRGLSGPHAADHGLATEVADLAAVLEHAGAERVFGVSAGGLVALEAARRYPSISKAALYEPALVLADSFYDNSWLPAFDAQIAAGKVPAAMVTSMFAMRLAPAALKLFPRGLLARLTDLMLKGEDKKAGPDEVTMRRLAPTIRHEGVIIGEAKGTEAGYADVAAEVLLLSGGHGLDWLRPGHDALAHTLPHARTIQYPDLDHGGSSDVTKANPKGRPDLVARDLLEFFKA